MFLIMRVRGLRQELHTDLRGARDRVWKPNGDNNDNAIMIVIEVTIQMIIIMIIYKL